MNERMQELYDQAFTLGTSGYSNGELDVEKFAELIVRECADVGERYANGNYEVYNQIMTHFGLEEE